MPYEHLYLKNFSCNVSFTFFYFDNKIFMPRKLIQLYLYRHCFHFSNYVYHKYIHDWLFNVENSTLSYL